MKFDIRTILAPFDFSERCRAAAQHAVVLAKHFDADLELIHAIPYSSFEYSAFEGGSYVGSAWPNEDDIRTRLDEEIEKIDAPAEAKARWKRTVVKGDPPRLIEGISEARPGPLIVMPTHGYGPFRRFVLGSVTAKVLHDVNYPVLTGAHLADRPIFFEAPYRRVACAVDLREHSRATLEWAWSFAQSWGAELFVVNAVNWLQTEPIESRLFTPELREKLTSGAHKEMQQLVAEVGCSAKVYADIEPIEKYVPSTATQADVLVIGRSLERGLLGRLREHSFNLIRESPCPVISV